MTDLSLLLIPIIFAGAAMLLLPHGLIAHARTNGSILTLAILLLTALCSTVLSVESTRITTSDIVIVTLAMMGASIAAAPLLDRARPAGLILAAPIAGLAVVSGSLGTSVFSSPAIIQTILIGAAIIGLGGSMSLPLHPSRHTPDGALRAQPMASGTLLAGWSMVALTLILLTHLLTPETALLPLIIAALIAALVALLSSRSEDALTRAGQGLVAGTLMALLAPASLEIAAILGIVSAFFVVRSTAITHALRIDDPHGITGSILIPAMFGLLLPGLLNLELLATQLIALGLSLLYGIGIAAILWPITKLLFGLALPDKIIRGES